MKEEGWVSGKDGILEKDGNRFCFEFIFNSGNSRREQVDYFLTKYFVNTEKRGISHGISETLMNDIRNHRQD
ncbi:hypothetical protein [Brevibacillus sp. 179-C9.3 HS]|uniref:hypothetical protein n=1 Tax=unclassified Brevibacillus TaxID=2684853 RepID=UPI0039A219A7